MKKVNLRSISEILSSKELKNVTGGSDGGGDNPGSGASFSCTCPCGTTYTVSSIDECRALCGV